MMEARTQMVVVKMEGTRDKIERQTEGLGENLDLGGKKGEVC